MGAVLRPLIFGNSHMSHRQSSLSGGRLDLYFRVVWLSVRSVDYGSCKDEQQIAVYLNSMVLGLWSQHCGFTEYSAFYMVFRNSRRTPIFKRVLVRPGAGGWSLVREGFIGYPSTSMSYPETPNTSRRSTWPKAAEKIRIYRNLKSSLYGCLDPSGSHSRGKPVLAAILHLDMNIFLRIGVGTTRGRRPRPSWRRRQNSVLSSRRRRRRHRHNHRSFRCSPVCRSFDLKLQLSNRLECRDSQEPSLPLPLQP